jgi:hypothetical protein
VVWAFIKEQRKVVPSPDLSNLLVSQLGFLFGLFPPEDFHILGWNRDLAILPVPDAMLG